MELHSDRRDDRFHWLALERLPRAGPLTIARLIEAFGSPQRALEASADEIILRARLKSRTAYAVAACRVDSDEIRKDMDLLDKMGVRVITRWDAEYPIRLKEIYDPPALLFVRGQFAEEDARCCAVVGTRTPTRYGIEMTERITRGLVAANITIASGLARGIDTACHKTAVKAEGRTIGVLGCGVDVVYPRENARLMDEMASLGAVVTEFRPGTVPHPTNFYRRNRIISGLSQGVLVVESGLRSGSLITARHALDQNRDVFAVPGNVMSAGSSGPHWLLKQGAGLVESAEDIIEALYPTVSRTPQPVREKAQQTNLFDGAADQADLSEAEALIMGVLDLEPVPFDVICESLGMEAGKLSGLLLELELNGLVRQYPGKFFSRSSDTNGGVSTLP
ncbi:MAG: DNA-processing protein DprA [Thermodesulfobacteriota bacterium]